MSKIKEFTEDDFNRFKKAITPLKEAGLSIKKIAEVLPIGASSVFTINKAQDFAQYKQLTTKEITARPTPMIDAEQIRHDHEVRDALVLALRENTQAIKELNEMLNVKKKWSW